MKAEIEFIDNSAATDQFTCITIDAASILPSWRLSMFSHEWLTPEGRIKDIVHLAPSNQAQRQEIEQALSEGRPLTKPILGIGIMDNIEIGSGRATLMTLIAHGIRTIPVHIPKSSEDEFSPYLCR